MTMIDKPDKRWLLKSLESIEQRNKKFIAAINKANRLIIEAIALAEATRLSGPLPR